MASSPPNPADADAALKLALDRLMAPLARLAVAHGLPFAVAEELLKRAYVNAARDALPSGVAGQRDISRVATATGLNRREVTRLTQELPAAAATRPSPVTEVFTRWVGDRTLHNRRGKPLPLPRQGPAPSFDALAQSVTRDVHPRSLLESLCRLGLVRVDDKTDTVHLVQEAFVPRDDVARLFGFLGQNVGDHLNAAVANVLADGKQHFEQAVFADELSVESLAALKPLVASQWQALMTAMVPELKRLIDDDQQSHRRADQRVRIGLYAYHDVMHAAVDGAAAVEGEPAVDSSNTPSAATSPSKPESPEEA